MFNQGVHQPDWLRWSKPRNETTSITCVAVTKDPDNSDVKKDVFPSVGGDTPSYGELKEAGAWSSGSHYVRPQSEERDKPWAGNSATHSGSVFLLP